MAQLILNVLLDGLMALLLVVTIAYCWRLNKRIQILQNSKSELAAIVRDFDEATQRATQSIGEIHKATSRIAENIQHKIDKANYLADDLQFMIEKGNKVADKMETGIHAGRGASPRAAAAATSPARAAAPASRAEAAELPRRSAAVEPSPADIKPSARPSAAGKESSRSSLDAVLQRVSDRQNEGDAAKPEPRQRPTARLRSKAEQELFDALKTGGSKS